MSCAHGSCRFGIPLATQHELGMAAVGNKYFILLEVKVSAGETQHPS